MSNITTKEGQIITFVDVAASLEEVICQTKDLRIKSEDIMNRLMGGKDPQIKTKSSPDDEPDTLSENSTVPERLFHMIMEIEFRNRRICDCLSETSSLIG